MMARVFARLTVALAALSAACVAKVPGAVDSGAADAATHPETGEPDAASLSEASPDQTAPADVETSTQDASVANPETGVGDTSVVTDAGVTITTLGTTTQTMGPGGGTISLGMASLVVPAGALSTAVSITMTAETARTSDGGAEPIVYQFAPDGLTFAVPATVNLPGTTGVVHWSEMESGLTVATELATSVAGGLATANVSHFSSGWVGPSNWAVVGMGAIDSCSLFIPGTGIVDCPPGYECYPDVPCQPDLAAPDCNILNPYVVSLFPNMCYPQREGGADGGTCGACGSFTSTGTSSFSSTCPAGTPPTPMGGAIADGIYEIRKQEFWNEMPNPPNTPECGNVPGPDPTEGRTQVCGKQIRTSAGPGQAPGGGDLTFSGTTLTVSNTCSGGAPFTVSYTATPTTLIFISGPDAQGITNVLTLQKL